MKKRNLAWLIVATLSLAPLASCEHLDLPDNQTPEQPIGQANKECKDVMFVLKGIQVDYATRATVQSEGMTDLWVYEGETLLKHQTSADSDFGTPTISLRYGSHDLTFVASKAEGQTFASYWHCSKLSETYGTAMNVTVSSGSSSSRQVELKRVNSKVQWTIEDVVPQTAATADVLVSTHYGLDASLGGKDAINYFRSIDISSRRGATNVVISSLVLPAAYGEETDCTATITFKDDADQTIVSYTNTVKVLANRVTNIHGSFFGTGGQHAVSLLNAWDEQNDVAL